MPATSALQQFHDDLRDPMAAQRETLKEILTKMSSVESLRERGIDGDTTPEDFVRFHPLTVYDDYEDLVRSVADGEVDPSELVGNGNPNERLLSFAVTSGTSGGRSKLIPWTAADLASRMRFFALMKDVSEREGVQSEGKCLTTMQKGTVTETPSGLLAGGALSQRLHDDRQRDFIQASMVSPVDICVLDSPHRVVIYAHLLSGLLEREAVDVVRVNFANEAVEIFLMLEEQVETIIKHLRQGVAEVDGLVDVKSLAILKPLVGKGKPDLADIVERECRAGFQGILPRLFPNCKSVLTVTSGTMRPYAKKLQHYAGDIPLVSSFYGASEGNFGLNTDPLQKISDAPLYTLCPRNSFFEFLPFPEGDVPVCLDKVEEGQAYEVVVTSRNCMFRYRLGDVVRVVKFEHKTPVVEFLHRKGAVLALTSSEMTTEKQLMDAVSQALQECGFLLLEYIFDADRDSLPPKYILYFEPLENITTGEIADFAGALDLALCNQNSYYREFRKKGKIGCMKLAMLRKGTFRQYRDSMIAKGTDPNQYKTPRCVNNELLKSLLRNSLCTVCPEEQ